MFVIYPKIMIVNSQYAEKRKEKFLIFLTSIQTRKPFDVCID